MKTRKYVCWLLALLYCLPAFSQTPIAVQRPDAGSKICLHEGWYARNVREIGEDGNRLTAKPFESTGWMKAQGPRNSFNHFTREQDLSGSRIRTE